MNDQISAEFAARLDQLRQQYASRLESDLCQLERDAQLMASSDTDAGQLHTLHQQLHKLAGSSGTFGFEQLGILARALENTAKQRIDQADFSPWQELPARVAELHQALSPQADLTPAADRQVPAHLYQKTSEQISESGRPARIMLLADDLTISDELLDALGNFGYELTKTKADTGASSFIDESNPDLIVVDLPAEDDRNAHEAFLEQCEQCRESAAPMVFLTDSMDFDVRLKVAQLRGAGHFIKPVDIPRLVDRIESVLQWRNANPHRILVVDDDEMLAEHYATVLRQVGMNVATLAEPNQLLDRVQQFRPELIVMDIHMPGSSGIDLARMIRLQVEWLTMPIIYLSGERDSEIQMEAINSGGDDFLVKPVSEAHLVAAVTSRVTRARQLSELMSRDSLTGLLKHSVIKEQLAIEVKRALRTQTPLCFVMLDIDHFKKVNDTYGHGKGDQVIKTLAHMLHQRLRRSDSIGRYGGEEFAVVLTDCTPEHALLILNDIREAFSAILFASGDTHFSVTLSAGVASLVDHPDCALLLEAADGALYRAKTNGRNRVELA
ncbi:diguanylate cyclase [Salinispirillum sp. LH 10-3-1]|uniref:diguanylate cyclase n=1 Tax=Salinispirillum sp. LH 10-3-1 TaxID=2952525 RepID=A0AB38YDV1_9GAMM